MGMGPSDSPLINCFTNGLLLFFTAYFISACATTSFDTAYKLQVEDRLDEAVPYWEKALLEQRLKGDHLNAAIVLNNLSRNYYLQKKYMKK